MTQTSPSDARPARIDPRLALGEVALTVRDLEGTVRFYEVALGLALLAREDACAVLGTPDGRPLVTLRGAPGAPAPAANATGLYHLAIALPTRADLARWLRHAAALGLRLGQNDHRTHEAFYLDDPEGNGIEVYHDWPQERWPFVDGKFASFDGRPIDLPGLLAAAPEPDAGWTGAPVGTRMGHVHLKTHDPAATRAFVEGVLGLQITADAMGAVFSAAGGYHHHFGHNAWHSRGGPAPAEGALGLRHATVELSDASELDAVTERLRGAGVEVRDTAGGRVTRDPSGNRLVLRAGPSTVERALAALK